ncbi:hypothetical protein DFH28DRAFT_881134 [Melampsora americana]|nr:hypothetical protein DFH28DRAFT_881134 [Melampsora americana]
MDPQSVHPNFKITYHQSNSNGPHQITCLHSDATSNSWPVIGPCPSTIKTSTAWESIDSKSKISTKWLSILGKGLAESLGLMKCSQKEDWRLTNFPKNYQLFNYIKGSLQDQYLFGSSHVRKFRTANEFLPHLQWLASSNSTITCQCTYCSGTKSQTESNSNFNHTSQPSKSKTSNSKRKASRSALTNHEVNSPEHSSQEIIKKRPSKKIKVVNRSSSETPAIPQSSNDSTELNIKPNYQGPYLSRDLKRDLTTDQSNFREHELIWCNIEDLLIGNRLSEGHDAFDLGTKYWPGLCEEMVLETQACITIDDDEEEEEKEEKVNKQLDKHSKRKSNESLINQKNLIVKRPKNKRLRVDFSKGTSNFTPSFSKMKSDQKYLWKIRLLGLEEVIKRDESELLPWLFQPMNISEKFNFKFKLSNYKTNLSNYLLNKHQSNAQRPRFNSFSNIENARFSFLLSLQIAANLEECWSTCDPYDLQADERDEDSDELIRRPIRFQSHSGNEHENENENGQEGLLNKSPEIWYQSLWWGAEKIWVFDTVRLNKIESDLPVGLLKAHENSNVRYVDPNDKAYFLKIDGIYRDEIEETLITIGKVYDLVAISSPSTSDPEFKPSSSNNQSNSPIVVVIGDDDDDESETQSRTKVKKTSKEPNIPNIPEDTTDTSFKYLPIPPKGYQFRQLTPFGKSNHVYLDCIAGRYYSPAIKNRSDQISNHSRRFLSKISSNANSEHHRRLSSTTPTTTNGNLSSKPKDIQRQNSSLFGLTAGRWNFMKCTKWKVNRMRSIIESERSAEEEVRNFERKKN